MEELLLYKDYFSIKILKITGVSPLLKLDLTKDAKELLKPFGPQILERHIKIANKLLIAYNDNENYKIR